MKKVILIFILILSFFLRFFQLGKIPIGFVSDEAAIGYNAYSILKTGKDEFGRFMPLTFESFGDNKPPLYIYIDTLAVKFFGLTKYAVRFPSALFGFLTVIICYLIFKKISNSENLALIGAGMLAISPWHLLFSRAAFEANLGLFLITLSILCYVMYLEKNKVLCLALFFTFNLLSLWTYHSNRVFVPIYSSLTIISTLILDKKNRHHLISLLLLLIFIIIPTVLIFSSKGNLKRANQISIFSNRETQLILNEKIREDGTISNYPVVLTRALHNKVVSYTIQFINRYLSHYNLNYLFFTGDNITRYRTKDLGLFYWWQGPFYLLGIFLLVKFFLTKKSPDIKNKYLPLIVIWFLTGPIPAALTIETPNALRSLNSLPVYIFITAIGLYHIIQIIHRHKIIFYSLSLLALTIIVYSFIYYLDGYYLHDVKFRPYYGQYEYEDLFNKLAKIKDQYQYVYLTEKHYDPYIFYLFYNRYEPALYQQKINIRSISKEGFIQYKGFDNLIFSDQICPLRKKKDTLFVCDAIGDIPPNSILVDMVKYQDGTPAFYLLEYNKFLIE